MKNIKLKGYTLIEIVLSLAIISVIVVAFLPIISSSYQWILNFGNSTKSLVSANSKLQMAFVDYNYVDEDVSDFESKITYTGPSGTTENTNVFIQSKINDDEAKDSYLFGYSQVSTNEYRYRAVNFAFLDVNKNRKFDDGVDIFVPRTEDEYNKVLNSNAGVPMLGGSLSALDTPCYDTYLEDPNGATVRYNFYGAELILPGNLDEPFIDVNHNLTIYSWGNIVLGENVKLESTGTINLKSKKNIIINRGNITAGNIVLQAAESESNAPIENKTLSADNTINGYIYIRSSSFISEDKILFEARKKVSISGTKQYGSGLIAKNAIELDLTGENKGVFSNHMLSQTTISIDRIDDESIYSLFKITGDTTKLDSTNPEYTPQGTFREIVESESGYELISPISFSGVVHKKLYDDRRVFVSRVEIEK